MTGDGVNDARPAQAEVGIAVSTATDVAKGAASVVLTEPGLTNIVALIGQGRQIYQRILTWIINKISRTILKAAFVAIAFAVTGSSCLRLCDAAAGLRDGLRGDHSCHRSRPAVQKTGNMEHRRVRHGIRGVGRRDGG